MSRADYKTYLKEKQVKNSSRKVTIISDSDDDFETPPKLLRTSNVNQPSPSSSSSPMHQSEVEDLSVHITCTTRFSSLEYRLAKVEADLAETGQLNIILKDKEKEIESVRAEKTKLEEEARQAFKCLICNVTATLPLAISPCCKIVLGCNRCVERWLDEEGNSTCLLCRQPLTLGACTTLPVIQSLAELLDMIRE